MRFQLVITGEAEADIADAIRWYDQQAGIGADFIAALDQRLTFIEQQPLAVAEVDHGIRRAVIARFPYNIYFIVNGRFINVLAVWHGGRDARKLSAAS
ncbi:MAG: type II toxin-antitoxin system RelE/ParE family toxin [Nevskia sp.]|nr:type II toxin-antitoxin system RelE/ParE family toxin [Nevskia sp.]